MHVYNTESIFGLSREDQKRETHGFYVTIMPVDSTEMSIPCKKKQHLF